MEEGSCPVTVLFCKSLEPSIADSVPVMGNPTLEL